MPLYVVRVMDEALAAATAETLLQVAAPATRKLQVRAWGISCDGVTASAVPGNVELLRQTTAGTGAAFTPLEWDEGDTPSLASAAAGTFSAEPTAGDIIHPIQLTPNGGLFECDYGDEGPWVAASGRIGIRATFAAIVNVTAWLRYKE